MRNSKWRIAWLFLSAAAVAGLAQETDSRASVAGRVTNSATGVPVLHAHVSLYPSTGSQQRYGALSDSEGKFSIAQLPPGRYSVSVDAAEFQSPPIVREARTDMVTLRPAEHKDDLNIALTPFGAISGRVLDADGRPVQGVAISALGADGLRGGDTSDPNGQYRLHSLPPGEYRVRAVPRSVRLAPEIRSDGSTEVRYASTYYPASLTPESAERLDVAPGAERTGIDVRLLRTPIVAVRGTVSGLPNDLATVGIGVRKAEPPRAPTNTLNNVVTAGFAHRVNPDGSFVIWGLDPGSYILTVTSNGAGWQSPPVAVNVAGKDVGGIELRVTSQFSISGQILLDDPGAQFPQVPPNTPLGQSPQIALDEMTGDAHAFSVVAADGSFHLSNVQPGRYSVRLTWRAYVKSMRLGSTNVEGAILDLRNGSVGAALTVTASSATARITGVVRNATGPAVNARVELLPEEGRSFGSEAVVIARPDGTYTFTNVAPGRYKLLALDAGMVRAFAIRHQLGDYADIVETVEVHPGDSLTRDLRQHANGPR